MEIQEFRNTIESGNLPPEQSLHVQALWYDKKGNWEKAHSLIDHLNDKHSSHVHAYLHRKEGDIWNADYWYKKAGKTRPHMSLDEEWEQLVLLYLK